MTNKFLNLLSTQTLLADGTIGTMLHACGVGFDELNLANPSAVAEIHRSCIEAGAQLIITNKFGANRFKLSNIVYRMARARSTKPARSLPSASSWHPPKLGMALTLSPSYQLISEQSTVAIIVHHPQAKYYSVGESQIEQLMKQ